MLLMRDTLQDLQSHLDAHCPPEQGLSLSWKDSVARHFNCCHLQSSRRIVNWAIWALRRPNRHCWEPRSGSE